MSNPEFRRYLWLELTAGRFLFSGVVLGSILLLLIGTSVSRPGMAEMIYGAYVSLFFLVSGFWGVRQAAASLPDEVTRGTWDAQRMSAMSAWSMGWGKVFGATSYTWLVGLSCLAIALLTRLIEGTGDPDGKTALVQLATMVLIVITGQAVAMTSSLAMLGLHGQRHAPRITLAQIIGLAAVVMMGMWFVGGMLDDRPVLFATTVPWWVWRADPHILNLLVSVVAAFFALLGVERCMRIELRQLHCPGAWSGAAAVFFLIVGGVLFHDRAPVVSLIDLALGTALFMLYMGLFTNVPDPVHYRILRACYAEGRYRQAAALLPLWVQSLAVLFLVCLFLHVADPALADWEWNDLPVTNMPRFAVILFLFACRDVVAIHLVRILVPSTRVIITWSIVLLTAYVLLPAAFEPGAFDVPPALALLLPAAAADYGPGFLFPLVSMLLLIAWWKKRTRRRFPV